MLDTNLGYRGFIVRVGDGKESSLIRVQRGRVQVQRSGSDLFYKDPDRGLERWLLHTAQPFLDSATSATVEMELSR